MTDIPTSRATLLNFALANYLEQSLISYKDISLASDINFCYYFNEHSSKMNPQGSIIVARTNLDNNTFYTTPIYSAIIRLLVSNSDHLLLIQLLLDWQELLLSKIIHLGKYGHSGTIILPNTQSATFEKLFLGISPDDVQIEPSINQDKGGTGAVLLTCTWRDNDSAPFSDGFH